MGGGGGYSIFRMALSIISEYGGLVRRGAYIRGGGLYLEVYGSQQI